MAPLYAADATQTLEQAAVAELAWRRPDGTAGAAPIVPLTVRRRPALALPYARAGLVRELGAAGRAVIVASDSRLAYKGWRPLAAAGRVELAADPHGDSFIAQGLLDQELRKHPPSRALADTPILRREHWWYLPRWIVRFDIDSVWSVGRRSEANHAVLAWIADGAVEADTVAVDDWDGDRPRVSCISGRDLSEAAGPATLLVHDFSIPDLERWATATVSGRLSYGRFTVEQRAGSREVGRPLSLLARMRALRSLERACRAELKSA